MTLCSCRHDSSTPGDITEHWQRTGALRGRAVELTFTLNRLLMNPWSEEEEAAAIGRKQNNKKKKKIIIALSSRRVPRFRTAAGQRNGRSSFPPAPAAGEAPGSGRSAAPGLAEAGVEGRRRPRTPCVCVCCRSC